MSTRLARGTTWSIAGLFAATALLKLADRSEVRHDAISSLSGVIAWLELSFTASLMFERSQIWGMRAVFLFSVAAIFYALTFRAPHCSCLGSVMALGWRAQAILGCLLAALSTYWLSARRTGHLKGVPMESF